MDQINAWKKEIEALLDEDIKLYDLKWRQDGKMKILQVSIMYEDGSMDVDTCARISGLIGDMLDAQDSIPYEYYLEVCSPGAERELRNEEEARQAIGEYVYVKFKDPKAGMHEVRGYLVKIDEEAYQIDYMAKNIKKRIDVAKDNVALMTLSVKI